MTKTVRMVKGVKINKSNLTNNTQKVALSLLSHKGWVSRSVLDRYIPSAAARVRDLRKQQFGSFEVECASASELGKRGGDKKYFYRIRPSRVSTEQVKTIFRI